MRLLVGSDFIDKIGCKFDSILISLEDLQSSQQPNGNPSLREKITEKKLNEQIPKKMNTQRRGYQYIGMSRDLEDGNAYQPPQPRLFGLTVFNVVGKIANIIRLIICIGLGISAIVIFLIGAGIISGLSGLLYGMAIITLIGAGMLIFDGSTAQWLVQNVLNRLTEDISRFEVDLKESRQQIEERAEQLKQSAEQIAKQEVIIGNITLIQTNMSTLITSLMNAQRQGVDLNELFTANLHKFDFLLGKMTEQVYNEMDMDKNGMIDREEYLIYVNKIREI